MKKVRLIVTIALLLVFALFAIGSGESSEGDAQGNLGDFSITIDSYRLAVDYEGDPVVIVKYIFENVSDDDAISFYTSVSDSVFQNGVGLNEAYFVDESANYNMDNATKEIKKGASIEVEVAYELNDTRTDIDVEVEPFFSFTEEKVKKTFRISG